MYILLCEDQKIADEDGVVVEEDENDQESNGSSAEALDAVVADTINDVASSQIPNGHEENKNSPNRNEVDPEMSAASTETNESRKKQAPKNVVTSWSEWLSKCSNSAASCQATKEDNKENASQNQVKTSQSQVKRYDGFRVDWILILLMYTCYKGQVILLPLRPVTGMRLVGHKE